MRSLFGGDQSDEGLVSLAGYVRFWGWAFAAVTVAIALLKQARSGGGRRGRRTQWGGGEWGRGAAAAATEAGCFCPRAIGLRLPSAVGLLLEGPGR